MRNDALDVLSPPGTRVVDRGMGVADGSIVTLQMGWWPVETTWKALHAGVRAPESFTDIALQSPFAFWAHQHEIEALDAGTSRLRDVVHYLPPRWVPAWAARSLTGLALRLLFGWRHRRTRRAVTADVQRRSAGGWFVQLVSGGV